MGIGRYVKEAAGYYSKIGNAFWDEGAEAAYRTAKTNWGDTVSDVVRKSPKGAANGFLMADTGQQILNKGMSTGGKMSTIGLGIGGLAAGDKLEDAFFG